MTTHVLFENTISSTISKVFFSFSSLQTILNIIISLLICYISFLTSIFFLQFSFFLNGVNGEILPQSVVYY